MSLDWDLTKIDKHEELWIKEGDGRRLSPMTEALIWACLHVGIGEITEKTVDEFYTRVKVWERGIGTLTRDRDGNEVATTYAEVKRHIGLRTNVFPKETDAAFARKIIRIMTDDARRDLRKQKEATVDA